MTAPRVLRVLVVDDEMLGRQRVEDLLAAEPGVEIVGTADTGDSAIEAIRTLKPDLVLLDVQMPGRTGLDVVRTIGAEKMPATIFVTAYDHYALKAFELAAVDYLVKPFDDERFEQAFRRARQLIELQEVSRLSEKLLAVLQGGRAASDTSTPASAQSSAQSATQTPTQPPLPPIVGGASLHIDGESHGATDGDASDGSSSAKQPYLERIAVEMRGQVRVVPVKQIDYITASGPYAELHVADKRYVLRERMQTLEDRLDPAKFFRIHRSAIVRIDQVEALLRNPGGDYGVQLKNGVRLKVSRNRFEELEKWMGI